MRRDDAPLVANFARTLSASKPPDIDNATALRWVRQAIHRAYADGPEDADDEALVETAIEWLRSAEPEVGEQSEDDIARASVRRAMARVDAAAPHRGTRRDAPSIHPKTVRPPSTRGRGAALAAAAAVLLILGPSLWWLSRPRGVQSPVATPLSETELPAGHRLYSTSDSHYRLVRTDDEHRIALEEGQVLFDVRPLGPEQTFVVNAGRVRVHVTGTVFSVERGERGVSVHVFEGSVEVVAEDERALLLAGQSFARGRAPPVDERLLAEGQGRADARIEEQRIVDVPPTVRNVAPPTREPTPAESATPPESASRPTLSPRPSEIRALLARRRYAEAERRIRNLRGQPDYVLTLLLGDALRGQGRSGEAANAYLLAMQRTHDQRERAIAGLSAARSIRSDDPRRALAILRDSGALAPASPVHEAAERLRARLGPGSAPP